MVEQLISSYAVAAARAGNRSIYLAAARLAPIHLLLPRPDHAN